MFDGKDISLDREKSCRTLRKVIDGPNLSGKGSSTCAAHAMAYMYPDNTIDSIYVHVLNNIKINIILTDRMPVITQKF